MLKTKLFDPDYKIISKHINNALKEELADSMVFAYFANTIESAISVFCITADWKKKYNFAAENQ